jgi:hypothetical protein
MIAWAALELLDNDALRDQVSIVVPTNAAAREELCLSLLRSRWPLNELSDERSSSR